jgi:Fe-S-cluster containining protein
MDVEQVVESGDPSTPLDRLLTAIAALKTELERLPGPDSAEYYGLLAEILSYKMPALHTAYDACVTAILITERKQVTCSKACSACCSHFVSSVEPYELIALDQHLKTRDDYQDLVVSSYRRAITYDKIVREGEAESAESAEDKALYRYFLRGHACPFLEKDGACGVYAYRPMACRMFFAESPPRFCEGKSLATAWNRNFQVELPLVAEEALARCSRLLEHLELPEDLFPGIVAVNGLFGRYDPSVSGASEAS